VKKLNPLIKEMDLKDSDLQWILTGLCAFCCIVKLRSESQENHKIMLKKYWTGSILIIRDPLKQKI
jgi:hypothetical protein